MFNLMLDKMKLFKWEFDWPLESALFWLLVVQVALIMFMVLVFAILIKRVGTNKIVVDTKPDERKLTGLTLDLSMVKRRFDVGEQFNCDGLVVTANYNLEPLSEPISKVAVFTPDTLEALQEQGPIEICYVISADTSVEGKVSVTVCYQGQQAMYVVSVGEQEEVAPTVVAAAPVTAVVQEPVAARTLVGLDLNLEVVQREFTVGDEFNCDGLMVTANYSEEPLAETIIEFQLVTGEEYDALEEKNPDECYVVTPDLSQEGKPAVTVWYQDKSAMYMVVVAAKEEEAEEEVVAEPEIAERNLVGITLDIDLVKREFTAGDEFDCDGLTVNAEYDSDPVNETITEFSVVDQQLYDRLTAENELVGCFVIKPDMSEAGEKTVTVRLGSEQEATYTIAVEEAPVVEEEQPKETVQEPDWMLDDEEDRDLVGLSIDVTVVQREFTVGEEFNCDGLLIHADFNRDPMQESIVEYSVVEEELFKRIASASEIAGCYVVKPDMSQAGKKTVTVKFENQTAYYTIAVGEVVEEEVVRELVSLSLNTDNVQKDFYVGDSLNHDGLVVTANYNVEPLTEEVQDYTILPPDMSKEGTPTVSVVYQDKMVGYGINIVALPEEERKKHDVVIEEESFEAGRLRYNRSFTARIIQSEDEIKFWYNDIKNEILAYKKAKCRMSWKRETFKVGKEVVAKLSFRGKTLCIFLPLNAADFADTKYQLEDVSDTPSNVDTPAMYRLKSAKRIKYAIELVALAMEKFGVPRTERIAEDYYMPYEGVVELIKKGLVKRDIKTAAEEAIFEQGKEKPENAEQEESEPIEIAPGLFVTAKTAEEKEREVAATESTNEATEETTQKDENK